MREELIPVPWHDPRLATCGGFAICGGRGPYAFLTGVVLAYHATTLALVAYLFDNDIHTPLPVSDNGNFQSILFLVGPIDDTTDPVPAPISQAYLGKVSVFGGAESALAVSDRQTWQQFTSCTKVLGGIKFSINEAPPQISGFAVDPSGFNVKTAPSSSGGGFLRTVVTGPGILLGDSTQGDWPENFFAPNSPETAKVLFVDATVTQSSIDYDVYVDTPKKATELLDGGVISWYNGIPSCGAFFSGAVSNHAIINDHRITEFFIELCGGTGIWRWTGGRWQCYPLKWNDTSGWKDPAGLLRWNGSTWADCGCNPGAMA